MSEHSTRNSPTPSIKRCPRCKEIVEPTQAQLKNHKYTCKKCKAIRAREYQTKPGSRFRINCTWSGMIQRCHRETHECYADYGGRGIVVCEGWRNSFDRFVMDMGPKPTPKHSLDRKDNSGNYSCGHCEECIRNGWPMNCRWATWIEQHNNKRNNVLIEFNGQKHSLSVWGRLTGLTRVVLAQRLNTLGWTVERAFTTPVLRGTRKGSGLQMSSKKASMALPPPGVQLWLNFDESQQK
jgi:hypothetical protein